MPWYLPHASEIRQPAMVDPAPRRPCRSNGSGALGDDLVIAHGHYLAPALRAGS